MYLSGNKQPMSIYRKCIFLLLFLSTGLFAQQTKLSFPLARLAGSADQKNMLLRVLIEGTEQKVKQAVQENGGQCLYSLGGITSALIPAGSIQNLASQKYITRIEQGSIRLHPLNDTMVYLNNVVEVHNGLSPLSQSYNGAGIVCGFIDTGIDFTHGDFKDSLGHTRIRYIWDQRQALATNTPQPFNYGQEWNNLQIDSGKCTHTDTLNWGHGTRVAGTAAGNGRAVNRYGGVAPKADIIMVAVDFNNAGPTIADGAKYIFAKAAALGKPCVINCSLGSDIGSHDAMDLEAHIIDSLLSQQTGRVFVAAAGNNGTIPYHLSKTIATDTAFAWMKLNAADTSSGNTTLDIQLYGDSIAMKNLRFSIGADKTGAVYTYRGATQFISPLANLGVIANDSIVKNGKRISKVQSYAQLNKGVYSLEYNFTPDSGAYNYRISVTGQGKFDGWSMNLVYAGMPTVAQYPALAKYKLPDTDETIETGFQCSAKVISVANYVNKNCFTDVGDTVICDTSWVFKPRQLAPSSSHGPSRTGVQKPDIAATGDYVMSCLVLSMKKYFSSTQLAKGGQHIAGGGTSQASPVISGIAALYLQKNPTAGYQEVKNAIVCSAKSDMYTGSSLPDYKWGYGKADAFHALTGCSALTVPDLHKAGSLKISPNPFEQSTLLSWEGEEYTLLILRDVLGKEITRLSLAPGTKSLTLPRGNLNSGVYVLSLYGSGKNMEFRKVVVH
jgi:subtilisin family serine protease